ncbi:ATP-binding protein [Burkholderia stabilis]|uniref:ATP-binding protein n=1 Tax=Burkholderia stabilis TaxID=95485 RepID=UPI00158D72FC|nr:ATP-binding protein [Burkholderia stabilis]HDR9488665.1 ATP-binding protein [Burkholderia stabilis]HDR9523678.1 ATP-binding protein [Burkholderia stabilis]HDR9531414.1 ATP-binding protein [Burkholderia stabilis]HDR9541032.1 ATP-binding protein [Burkholderia stabilis]HDR9544024.1 ATP-binding protein [Burkholderia stabilis]
MTQIAFQVDTSRVLEILSKQIYDSPYAMARENVQNAYDAVLMRANREQKSPSEYQIVITARPDQIEISDQGIGMTEKVLRENFWRAGSSGKNNDAARAAGVIGTFGIGAMANFGVCDRLQIDTRAMDQATGIRTFALKSQLSIGQDCISLENLDSSIEVGTKLTAQISPTSPINVQALRNYLAPFVRFLTVPVLLNGELLSQQDVRSAAGIGANWRALDTKQLNTGRFAFEACVLVDGNQVAVVIDKLMIDGEASPGGAWLRNGAGQVMGLRSRFGLAPIPLPTHYQLGGFADLPFLLPTAGREALTRESIQEATQLISPIESALTEALKDTDLADTLQAFQQHLIQIGRIDWAGRVSIQLSPGDQRMELGKLRDDHPGVELHWYTGTDSDQINTFASEDSPLIRVSQTNPRREIQQRYLRDVLRLPEVPNVVSIVETYDPRDLSFDEVTLMLAIARVLRVDYLIDDIDLKWVKLSHGVPMLTEMTAEKLTLKISRTWSAVQAVIQVIASTPEVAEGMTRDFVRVHVYERIKEFVPSSQRAGLDALQKTLARRRELYRLEVDDKGELEPLLAEYLAGHVQFIEVLNAATRVSAGHTQRVSSDTVGTVENALNDVVNAKVEPQVVRIISAPESGSPILRTDTELRERLLTTEREILQLNNHRVFLALSDRLFQLEREFFTFPHSTQVAWAGRRIVYLFGLSHSSENLYYDIELRGARSAGSAGGAPLITTTIVTKNRIFVPIPAALVECFTVATDPVEFYVRFDRLLHK